MRLSRYLLLMAIVISSIATVRQSFGETENAEHTGWIVIHAGTLLAVPGRDPVKQASIIIRGNRIESIQSGFVASRDVNTDGAPVRLIDLSDSFVLPGLIDAHDHITAKPGRNKRLWITTKTDADQALYGAHYAKLTLEAGFTTVRNIGSTGLAIYALRDAIDNGLVPGPRLQVSGSIISVTGGHGDKSTGFRPDLYSALDDDGLCDGIESCRRAVRLQIKKGSDWIKVMATGGVNSEAATGVGLHFDEETLRAIVDTAHKLGRKVAAHAHAADGVNAALRAGVDSIEHGAFLDDSSIRLFKETGAWLVATLSVGEHVLAIAEDPTSGMSDAVRQKARVAIPTMNDNVGRAYKAGVKIAFGTDSGEPEHGENANEFLQLVGVGMSEIDAIKAATVTAAELMGLSDELGTIEAGKYADIVATGSSPLDDIAVLKSVHFVMKDGVVFKNR